MEQIERQNNTADSNNKKKVIVDSKSFSRNSIAHFEDLSNELIYEIFEFLDFCQVFDIFFNLNIRFQNLLTHSILPVKIKLISASKSTFQHYHRQIIIPNQHRIKSLFLSNPFIVDRIFSSDCIELKLIQLEALNLDKIQSTYLESLLEYLFSLTYLSSLRINCGNPVQNKNNLYKQIFRLSALKYCNLSFDSDQSEPLPIATSKFSLIEHFILNNTRVLDDLNNILSYLPHLNRLVIHSRYYSPVTQMQPYSSALKYLTHVSLNGLDIPFDQLESMSPSLFNHVQVLHISNCYSREYFDADRWQRMIVSHMPYLRIFDIFVFYTLHWSENIINFITITNRFNAPFWFKRQWFFEYHVDESRTQNSISFYSTNPYRRKQYTLYEDKTKNMNTNSQKLIMNSVHQIEIRSEKAMVDCQKYFPNVTELTILFNTTEQSVHHRFINLGNIISLNQLTKFIFRSYQNDFHKIIDLLQWTPNIHTFKIEHVVLNDSDLVTIQQSNTFRLVSQTNKIQNLIITYQCTFNELNFIVNLCPRLQQLTIEKSHKDLESFLRNLLSDVNEKLHSLFLLCITFVNEKETTILETLLRSERLLNQYSLQIRYDSFYQRTYLWW